MNAQPLPTGDTAAAGRARNGTERTLAMCENTSSVIKN
jgi:hypothetical protein